jgi:UDP-GlcNAc:undecaprenyl-phosphate GlcNAc-1-phosphate transferase
MAILFAAAITSYVISFLIIPVIIKYSLEKNLVDIPGRRKIHKKLTPSMGGIAIFIAFFIASLVWIDLSDWKQIRIILMSLFIIFFMGIRDDIIPLRPYMKIIGQVMASSLLIFLFDLRLRSFYGILGIYEIPFILSCILTVFTIIVVTNSFNLIDGLDGLAGTIASVALLFFGISFYLAGDLIYATLAFCMLGAIVAFLFFNWEPSEIFMGDTGALVIGMMLSILAIHFIDLQSSLPVENTYRYKASISGAVAVLCIPLADTLRIFILRLLRRQSPFKPDKNHIHHTFLRLGFSHTKSTIILAIIQSAFIVIVFMLRGINDNYLMLGIISAWVIGSLIIQGNLYKRL